MSNTTTILALIVMGLVVLVLIRGLFNMLKGTNANRSNKLMQLRLMLQAIAVALIMLTLWLTGGGRPTRCGRIAPRPSGWSRSWRSIGERGRWRRET